ncbi:MAG: hypothetical protein R2695_08330 [Acidimicrobiales bacterium]
MAPSVIAGHIARIRAAAEKAGRPEPRIKAIVTVALTDDPAAVIAQQRESSTLMPDCRPIARSSTSPGWSRRPMS